MILFIKTNKDTKFKQLIDITVVDYPEENQRFRKELNDKDKAIYKLTNQLERSSILIGKYVAGQEEIVDSVSEYNKTIDEQSKTIELQKKLITKMYKEKVELEKRVQQTIN